MAVVHAHLDQPSAAIFSVLSDPWRYADWVVGAKRIRGVDSTWPEPGSRFHHRVGVGPLTIEDSTVVEAYNPPNRLVLRARARPAGIARVTITLVPTRDGGTDVELEEYPVGGPARWIHNPLLDALIAARNRKSLRELERLVTTPADQYPG
jgi:uncharacterized protein YndB with AHSA1/START domain